MMNSFMSMLFDWMNSPQSFYTTRAPLCSKEIVNCSNHDRYALAAARTRASNAFDIIGVSYL